MAESSAGSTDIVSLLASLIDAQRKDITRGSRSRRPVVRDRARRRQFLRGATRSRGLADAIEGRPDRLPLGLMTRRLEAIADRPLMFIWKEIVESWVIGQ